MTRHRQCLLYLLLDMTAFIQKKAILMVGPIINFFFSISPFDLWLSL